MKLKEKDYAKLVVAAAKSGKDVKELARALWFSMYQSRALSKIDRVFNMATEIQAEEQKSLIATIYSAINLSTDQRQDIELELKDRYKKEIIANYVVDVSLGTGLKVIAGDKLIDLTSKHQIERLNNCLNKRGTGEK